MPKAKGPVKERRLNLFGGMIKVYVKRTDDGYYNIHVHTPVVELDTTFGINLFSAYKIFLKVNTPVEQEEYFQGETDILGKLKERLWNKLGKEFLGKMSKVVVEAARSMEEEYPQLTFETSLQEWGSPFVLYTYPITLFAPPRVDFTSPRKLSVSYTVYCYLKTLPAGVDKDQFSRPFLTYKVLEHVTPENVRNKFLDHMKRAIKKEGVSNEFTQKILTALMGELPSLFKSQFKGKIEVSDIELTEREWRITYVDEPAPRVVEQGVAFRVPENLVLPLLSKGKTDREYLQALLMIFSVHQDKSVGDIFMVIRDFLNLES